MQDDLDVDDNCTHKEGIVKLISDDFTTHVTAQLTLALCGRFDIMHRLIDGILADSRPGGNPERKQTKTNDLARLEQNGRPGQRTLRF